jgi:hypothetical protein
MKTTMRLVSIVIAVAFAMAGCGRGDGGGDTAEHSQQAGGESAKPAPPPASGTSGACRARWRDGDLERHGPPCRARHRRCPSR